MIRDRRTKKWTSFFVPEHVKMQRQHRQQRHNIAAAAQAPGTDSGVFSRIMNAKGAIMLDIQEPAYWREWVIGSAGLLRLKPGAPADVQAAFDRLMRDLDEAHRDPGADPSAVPGD